MCIRDSCPIVATYPEVIANNMDELFREEGVVFSHPFVPYDDDKRLVRRLLEIFADKDIPQTEIREAVRAAREEENKFKDDVRRAGEEALRYISEHGKKGIILSGRPYHLDKEINHGINKMITSVSYTHLYMFLRWVVHILLLYIHLPILNLMTLVFHTGMVFCTLKGQPKGAGECLLLIAYIGSNFVVLQCRAKKQTLHLRRAQADPQAI